MLKHYILIFIALYILWPCSAFGLFSQQQNAISDKVIYEDWLSVTEKVHLNGTESVTSVYDRLSDEFFHLYRSTGNTIYLVFSLHEAGKAKRAEITGRLTESEFESVSGTLKKLNDAQISADYYDIQPFGPENIYHFWGITIPDELEEQAIGLLDYWAEQLPATYQTDYLKASFKAQALVIGYYRLGKDHRVQEIGEYLTNSHPFPPSLFSLNLFESMAYSARVSGFYLSALDIYQRILLEIAETLDNKNDFLTIRMNYANTLFRIGNVNVALQEYEAIFADIDHLRDSRYRAALFNNLAISYLNSGRFDQYVQFQLNAYEIAREENDYGQQLSILRNLFIYYRRQNDTELAFTYLSRALELAQENELSEDIASILISLGIYKRTVEDNPGAAITHFYEAAELSEGTNQYHYLYNSYLELAESYQQLENYSEAHKYFTNVIELSNSRDDVRGYLQANVRYANMLSKMGDFENAGAIMSEFRNHDFQQLNFNIRVLANNVNVRLLMHHNNLSEASSVSGTLVEEIIHWLRESMDHQTGHMRMDNEFSEAFRLHANIMHQTENQENALAVAGNLRNISRSGFYNNPLLKSQILSEEDLIRDLNLSNRIQQLRRNYADANEQQRVYLGNELLNAISERNSLQNRAFPNSEEADYTEKLSTIRRSLQPDQVVLYFSVFEDQIFQFVVTRSDIQMNAYPDDNKYIELLRSSIDTMEYGRTDLTLLHEVYTTFYEGKIPSGTNHIYVIPDGDFYRLPIEILPVEPVRTPGSYGSANYLIERYSVSYINTLSDLIKAETGDEIDYEYDLAGFAINNFAEAGHHGLPNLPFSPAEIMQSAEKLDKFSNKAFFLDSESTESNFRDIAGNARILHLATHSKVNDENPLFSSLYLYRENDVSNTDGIIHAYELFDMNLNADLVFLSSCESGAGGFLKGAGVLGFSRAFSYAGAKSLSMNLWPVRDQTAAEISLRFYESLNEGNNKAEALRAARVSYLNNNNSDPYLWGGFVLYGDIGSPLEKSTGLFPLIIPGAIAVAGVFMIFLILYRKQVFPS
jgi:CHAT domain-containing protein/tetratricopeptide (TPR) repeat protein